MQLNCQKWRENVVWRDNVAPGVLEGFFASKDIVAHIYAFWRYSVHGILEVITSFIDVKNNLRSDIFTGHYVRQIRRTFDSSVRNGQIYK